jgi:hypothetical protein
MKRFLYRNIRGFRGFFYEEYAGGCFLLGFDKDFCGITGTFWYLNIGKIWYYILI